MPGPGGAQRAEDLPAAGVRWDFAGGRMLPLVGDLANPALELEVHVSDIRERPAAEEAVFEIADGALHLALGLGPIGPASRGLKPNCPQKERNSG